MSSSLRLLSVLVVVVCLTGCGGDPVMEAAGEPTPAMKIETYPDPPAEVADEVMETVRQWVAERADENGVYDIPPRGDRNVAGVLGEFHTVHQKGADTFTVCVDFQGDDGLYDVDFFVDRTDQGLAVREAYLHKVDGEVVPG